METQESYLNNKLLECVTGDIIKFHTGNEQRDSVKMKVCFNMGCFGFRSLEHNGVNLISAFMPFSVVQNSLEDVGIWKDAEDVLEVVGDVYENKNHV